MKVASSASLGLSIAIVGAVAALMTAGASAYPQRQAELSNPQQVANATFPSVHRWWQQLFSNAGVAYHLSNYSWYNKPGNRRWIRIPRGCDAYQTRGDGWMWGGRSSEYRPNSFYCTLNEHIYLDWTFLRTIGFLNTRKWGPGDDARVALVLAHEYGHHIQHLLVFPEQKKRRGQVANYELHADCYAGAWFAHGERAGVIERGDTLNANTMLGYLGDADGTPWNEASAHGGHSDRQEWFTYGYETENPRDCDGVFD